jgi:hypothetical protein
VGKRSILKLSLATAAISAINSRNSSSSRSNTHQNRADLGGALATSSLRKKILHYPLSYVNGRSPRWPLHANRGGGASPLLCLYKREGMKYLLSLTRH